MGEGGVGCRCGRCGLGALRSSGADDGFDHRAGFGRSGWFGAGAQRAGSATTGHIFFGTNAQGGALVVEQRAPNQIREELTVQGGKVLVRAYDGTVGWVIDPVATPPGFRRLAGDDLKNLMADSHFEPLVNVARTGDRLKYVGIDTASGKPAWKVMVTQSGTGYRDYYYVDSVGVARQVAGCATGAGRYGGVRVVFPGLRRGSRGIVPAHIESSARGSAQRQRISIDRIGVNPNLDASRFAVPADTTSAH